MKKVIIIAMLLSLLSVCGLSAGVCLADETVGTTYYYVNQGSEITMYSSSEIGSAHAVMQIPSTYAFKYVAEANSNFAQVEYNGCVGYVLAGDLNDKCTKVTDKWGKNPYYYTYNASDFNTFNVANVTAYYYDNNAWTVESNSTPASLIAVTNVYGYYKDSNQELYFLVDYVINVSDGIGREKRYIKASDFSTAHANVSAIPQSEGYKTQTAQDSTPTTGGSISSGNGSPSAPKDTSNAFERYILIAVIAVLCVVIVILIFAPAKKRKA